MPPVEQMTVDEKIAFFFEDPRVDWVAHHRGGDARSVLYMVRQEALDCLVGEEAFAAGERDAVNHPERYHRLFATTIVTFAGLDLLAKFYAGTYEGDVGKRFRDFVSAHSSWSKDQVRTMWTVRNTLMHSFGLYSPPYTDPRSKKVRPEMKIGLAQFCPVKGADTAPVLQGREHWVVCVPHHYGAFLDVLEKYRERVEQGGQTAKDNFERIFKDFGFMPVKVEVDGST